MIDRITEQPFCQTRVSGSTFVNADCFDVFPFIEDKSIDAIICDLPYGTTNCKWDSILPLDNLWAEYKRVIKDNGVIVLHDCSPEKEEYSLVPRISGPWNGDVYKSVLRFRQKYNHTFFTVDTDCGCGVIINDNSGLNLCDKEILNKGLDSWNYFDPNRKQLLNLLTIGSNQD